MQANADRIAAGAVALRKDIYNLTSDELAAYREAIQKVMERTDNKSYNYLAGIHGKPQHLCVHHRWQWLPWHRAYLYLFEQCLQDQVPGVTIPWWDWTSAETHTGGIPPAFTALTTPDGEPNPLLKAPIHVQGARAGWPTETHRSPGSPADHRLPTAARLEACARIPFFNGDHTGFSEAFAGIHDDIHNWVGGEMGNPVWAAYDPLFWSHHCMVDRVFNDWQTRPSQAHFVWDPQLLGTALDVPGLDFTVARILDITKLGYGYASLEVTATEEADT